MFTKSDAIHITIKPRGPICNLSCKYCYYLSKSSLYNNTNFSIKFKTYILLLENLKTFSSRSTITWQGGEPTLRGLDFFKAALDYQKKHGIKIRNYFQTNGINLNKEWIEFFKENDFLVGISLDGPKELHEKNRVSSSKESYYEKIISNIRALQKYDVDFNILTTVNKANVNYAKEVYDYFVNDLNVNFLQFIPIVQSVSGSGFNRENKLNPASILPEEYANFMISIFDMWYKNDVGKVSVQLFEVIMSSWLGTEHGLCEFQKNCGQALCLEHNGDLYACDHFVEKDFLLGNIHEKSLRECFDNQKFYDFRTYKRRAVSKECVACEYFFICHGECPKNWILKDKEGKRKNYLCESYKKIFKHTSGKLLALLSKSK
ncbi:MAG: anaerobic sulfatase maturase [Bdellovibrionota bacterium]